MTGEKRTDSVAAYLAEVKEHCGRSDPRTPAGGGYAIRSAQHVPRLVAAIEAVLGQHRPVDRGRVMRCCHGCEGVNGEYHEDCCHEWPCPTYETISRALTAALATDPRNRVTKEDEQSGGPPVPLTREALEEGR